jgi:hypothetical protein
LSASARLRDLYRIVDPSDAPARLKAWCTAALRSRIKAFTNLVNRIRKHFNASSPRSASTK